MKLKYTLLAVAAVVFLGGCFCPRPTYTPQPGTVYTIEPWLTTPTDNLRPVSR